MTLVIGTLHGELALHRNEGLHVRVTTSRGQGEVTLSLADAQALRSRLRITRLNDMTEYADGDVIVYDRRNAERKLKVYVLREEVVLTWEHARRLVAWLDSLDLTPRRRTPLVLKDDVRDAQAGEVLDPRASGEQDDEATIDEGPAWKRSARELIKKRDRDLVRTLRDKQADPKSRKPEVFKAKAKRRKPGGGGRMAKDTSVRSGGKLLGGVKLKNGTQLQSRRTGKGATFKGFTQDGRVKILKDGDKKAVTVSRATLAAAYVVA